MNTTTVLRSIILFLGAGLDGMKPGRTDVVGAAFCIVGVAVLMYWPRGAGL